MNIFKKVINDIQFSIPQEILKIAFQDTNNWRQAPVSIDEMIMMKVLRHRVLIDANLVGGEMTLIPLNDIQPIYLDTYSTVYGIPLTKTLYKKIISVLSVSYMPNIYSNSNMGNGVGMVQPANMNDVSSAAQRLVNSHSNMPPISTAYIELVGENTVLIRNEMRIPQAYILRCILANDDNLNNIHIRSFPNFSKLCQLAVKSYIYNTLIIKIGSVYLQGGQELGYIKDYIDTLSDSEEMYNTYLNEVWRPTAFMNDTHSYTRFLKMMTNPGI